MKKLKYICAQPRLLYYAWQVELMIVNFIEQGIEPSSINILIAFNPKDLTSTKENIDCWIKLEKQYNEVNFYFYEDTRKVPIQYISSVRPNILKQHFMKYPELKDEVIFYHDCDIIFSKKVDWSRFVLDDIWYLSDTSSYINYNYITSKGMDVYEKMCEIVKIDPLIPKLMNSNSGGAQYIMKNLDWEYWEKVEFDCEKLYSEITKLSMQKKSTNPSYHELQIWCADMWAVLWNAWLRGNETKIIKEMDFSWATDSYEKTLSLNIYHNAGVVGNSGDLFLKSNYINRLPYLDDLSINKSFASNYYWEWVKKVRKKSALL